MCPPVGVTCIDQKIRFGSNTNGVFLLSSAATSYGCGSSTINVGPNLRILKFRVQRIFEYVLKAWRLEINCAVLRQYSSDINVLIKIFPSLVKPTQNSPSFPFFEKKVILNILNS